MKELDKTFDPLLRVIIGRSSLLIHRTQHGRFAIVIRKEKCIRGRQGKCKAINTNHVSNLKTIVIKEDLTTHPSILEMPLWQSLATATVDH